MAARCAWSARIRAAPSISTRSPATRPAVEQLLCEGLEFARGPDHPGRRERFGEVHHRGDAGRGVRAEPRRVAPPGQQLFSTRDGPPGSSPGPSFLERGPIRPPLGLLPARRHHAQSLHLPGRPSQPPAPGAASIQLSHGEGFLEILRTRVNQPGFYLMDEPDAPLSFTASLGLDGPPARSGPGRIPGHRGHSFAPHRRGPRRGHPGTRGLGRPRLPVGSLHIVSAWRRFLAAAGSYSVTFRRLIPGTARRRASGGWAAPRWCHRSLTHSTTSRRPSPAAPALYHSP